MFGPPNSVYLEKNKLLILLISDKYFKPPTQDLRLDTIEIQVHD